ncbi:MAG TPA: ABC transporter permease subunit [Beijerinckiaceae bacterium]
MREVRSGLAAAAVAVALAALADPTVASGFAAALGAAPKTPVPPDRLLDLAARHAALALASVAVASCLGVTLGVVVTRSAGAALRPLVDTLVAALQAVPPVVVVALAFPALGFGAAPTVLALVFYCVMPVLRGTIAAIEAAPAEVKEAARAMGFTRWQLIREVEVPLALPLVSESVRVALVLAVATAAVGALAGAATLGTPIITGLQNQNELQILQGAAATAALAFLAEAAWLLGIGLFARQPVEA